MKKLGYQARATLDKNEHPLSRSAMIDLATSLVWDGNTDGALALVKVLIDSMVKARDRDDLNHQSDFYMLLGMRSALAGVVGNLKHKREDRAEHRFGTKSARRTAKADRKVG